MERLREIYLQAYERLIGLEISGKGKPAPFWATNRWVSRLARGKRS
jgi:hypothetical protein